MISLQDPPPLTSCYFIYEVRNFTWGTKHKLYEKSRTFARKPRNRSSVYHNTFYIFSAFLTNFKHFMKEIWLLCTLALFGLRCTIVQKEYHYSLNEVEIKFYKKESNIFKADSVKALAMLLNRECPTCSFEEKVHVASCVVTGSKSLGVSWKEYLFNKGQFWGFTDTRIQYDPKVHQENLKASIQAWEAPKRVRFYASKIDTKAHFNSVKKKGFIILGFYHYFRY